VLGLAIPAMFVHQLTRGVVRTRVVESLSDIALMVVAVVGCAALMQLRHETLGALMTSGFVLAAGAALVAGHLVDLFAPRMLFDPDVPRGLLAVIAGAMAGAVACFLRLHNSFEFDHKRSLIVGGAWGPRQPVRDRSRVRRTQPAGRSASSRGGPAGRQHADLVRAAGSDRLPALPDHPGVARWRCG